MTEPTEVDEFGTKFWGNPEGDLHREDGPAVEFAHGRCKEWWLNGKLHRLDGPAIDISNGHKEWYINGEELTEEEHAERVKEMQDD